MKKLTIAMFSVIFISNNLFSQGWLPGTNSINVDPPPTTNVGIGTTNPQKKLEVIGDISLPNNTGQKQIFTYSPTDNNWRIGMYVTTGFTRALTNSYVQYLTYSTGSGQGFALGVNGGNSSFEIRGSDHQAYFRGKIGIGTITPNSMLQISSEGNPTYTETQANAFQINGTDQSLYMGVYSNNHVSYLQAADIGTGPSTLTLNPRGGNVGIGTGANILSSTLQINSEGNPNNDEYQANAFQIRGNNQCLYMGASSTSTPHVSYIQSAQLGTATNTLSLNARGGSVTIGTINAHGYTLAVNGSIITESITCMTYPNWPDYVFAESYKLTPLKDVELFINKNKHLPEIPSAEDINKKGVNLGEMNALLLKKVEELTLYIIDLNKQIQQIQQQIDNQNKPNK